MTGLPVGMMVELLVAVLLLITIGYCVVVHGKLKWLKSDQAKLIKVIGELNAATANAEHAVAALSTVSSGAEKTLQTQLERSREVTSELSSAIVEAEHFLSKITQIVRANEGSATPAQQAVPAQQSVAAPASVPVEVPAKAPAVRQRRTPVVRPSVKASDIGLGRLNAMRRSEVGDKEVA